jgi:hypothetical protein
MLGIAGVVYSNAQPVYSVNVVGYMTLTLTNPFSLIANQLDNGSGNLTNMFTGLPLQTAIYKFNGTSYDSLTWVGSWTPAGNRGMDLKPGEGVFVRKPASAASITVTFVGEVLQGHLVNYVNPGFDIYSGMVPQEGGIVSIHGYVPVNQDVVYKYTGTGYSSKTWLQALNRWNPVGEPVLGVGEAVFIKSASAVQREWSRDFTVQ